MATSQESERYKQLEEQIVQTHEHLDHLHAAKAKAESEEASTAASIDAAQREVDELSAAHRCAG